MKKVFLRILLPILLVLTLAATVTVIAIATGGDEENLTDAMVEIRSDEYLEANLLATYTLADDGYIGIPIDFAIYHNGSPVEPSYNGTSVIMYVVNTYANRTGTDSDVSIIKSMIDRGYIVAVADYGHNKKAVGADLDWGAHHVVQSFRNGAIFKKAELATEYRDSFAEVFLVPAGHNIERDLVYWSYDKHSIDGTLEKIVNVWNNDFRGQKGSVVIPWYNEDGFRKETQPGIHDGSDPVWYSPGTGEGAITYNGKSYVPDPENGLYICVKHTKAEVITDCVKRDGSPIDLDLYMHVIYPTNPTETVPVMALASSSEHLASAGVSSERPHSNGFGFDGYGVVMYDYGYVPMARKDHYSYFDGSSMDSGSVTGDNMTYSLYTYNMTLIPTAAMRYVRYLALTQPEKYAFNGKIGVIGNSKGSMITQLADKSLGHVKTTADGYTEAGLETYAYEYIKSYVEYYYFEGKTDSTRYDEGLAEYTRDGFTIRAGEIQPWLTYEGEMIPSNAQFVYSSCGITNTSINENFAPFMTTGHIGIESNGYGSNNAGINIARYYDLPFLWFELVLGHTFLARECVELDLDPYIGYKSFVNYVLDDGAPLALYATPLTQSEITATPSFTVKFTGIISAEEISKATLTDSEGNAVVGVWTSQYGKTEWTFTPSTALKGGETYTLNVPTTIVAENGQNVAEPFSTTYYVEPGETTNLSIVETVVSTENGLTIPVTVPNFSDYSDKNINRAELRLFVSDNAANSLSVYMNDENGECLATVPVGGIGQYGLNLTKALGTMTPGEVVTLFVKADKATGETRPSDFKFSYEDFEDAAHGFYAYTSVARFSYEDLGGEHGKALKIEVKPNTSRYTDEHTYYMLRETLEARKIIPAITDADYGRRFLITYDVYDTSSRSITTALNRLSNASTRIIDYHHDYVNATTKANEWMTVSLLVTLDDPLYGKRGLQAQDLHISIGPSGGDEAPIYIDNFTVTEITTDLTVSAASLVLTSDGGEGYKTATGELPYLVGSTAYATLQEAIAALGTSDGTITLQSNAVVNDTDLVQNLRGANVTIDLNGYAIHSESTYNSFVSVNTASIKSITIKNGSVFLFGGSLVGFEGNTKAAADVTVTFENVHIGTEFGANVTQLLVHADASSGTPSKLQLVLDNCSIDARIERLSKTPATIFPTDTAKVDVSYTVRGGEVYMTRMDKTTFCNSMKDILFEKDDEGAFTTLYMTAARDFTTTAVITEDGFANFALDESVTARPGYLAYSPNLDGDLSTSYGIVPEKYADKDLYPLVIFDLDTFECLGASDILIQDSGEGVFNTVYNKTGNYVIVLRRHYTHKTASYNIGFLNCNVTVDLNGYTMTYEKTIAPQSKKANYDCNVTFTNGTLKAATSGSFLNFSAVADAQPMTFTFDQVTFAVAEGYAPTAWVSRTAATSSVKADGFPIRLTVKDCIFDVSGLSAKTTLFVIGHAQGLIDDQVTVIGSNILGSADNVTLYSTNGTENCSIVFEANENGDYITNTRPTTAPVPDIAIKIGDEIMIFNKEVSTKDGMTTYALSPDPLVTPYGRIPNEYAQNPDKYPILLFQLSTGNVIWAGDRWGGETAKATYNDDGSVKKYATTGGVLYQIAQNKSKGDLAVYFQKDHIDAPDDNGAIRPFYNFGCLTGNYIIDLNGHTLTAAQTLFYAEAKNNSFNNQVTWTLKNGTIDLNSCNFLEIKSGKYDKQYTMDATYVIENVDFKNITTGYVVVDGSSDLGFLTNSDVTFRNCNFEVVEKRDSKKEAIFYLGSSAKSSTFSVNITVEGGSFSYLPNTSLPTIFRDGGMDNKTFIFGEGKSGLPTVTVAKTSTVMYETPVKTTLGDRYFIQDQVDEGEQTTFYLCQKHEYGYIPHKYTANPDEYTFLLFQLSTGKILWAGNRWGGESTYGGVLYQFTKYRSKGDMAVLMIADFAGDVHDPNGKLQTYNNFGTITGNHIIDFNGHTFTAKTPVFNAQAKSKNFESAVTWTIKNGTIDLNTNNFIQIASNKYDQQYTMQSTFIIENIRFTNIDGSYIVRDSNNGSGDFLTTTDITFRGCTFENATTRTTPLFSMGTTGTSTFTVNIKVEGGQFVFTGTKTPTIFSTGEMENKTLTFGKYNGKYPTVLLPEKVSLNSTLPCADGVLGMRRVSVENGNVLYAMTPFSFVSAYLNLTSELNLVYRAYLPEGYTNPTVTFTLLGMTTTVSAFAQDENGLYLFKLPSINPAQMGNTVKATLSAIYGGEEVSVTCDKISVKSYLEQLKAQNGENETLVELIDKLLVYGAAAQQYVGQSADSFVAEIGELAEIAAGENVITLTGEGSDVAAFTKLSLSLDGAYALHLKIALAGTEGLSLKVTKGGVSEIVDLSTYEIEDGIIVVTIDDIYANELSEQITFTVMQGGVEIGKTLTASVNAYLYRTSLSSDDSLSTLAKALYAYGEAAKAYAN